MYEIAEKMYVIGAKIVGIVLKIVKIGERIAVKIVGIVKTAYVEKKRNGINTGIG